ncbi:hypothetical protein LMG24238_01492 [Paraburkholderia sediminicola]|uniref:Uncharacterized protein n=1 Tax=Paraburkholderia sediminicola TaxID=458836 RepID=A0A6J5AAA1_9BURK|nr:hypothetical protein [Paraburkholderia sediminicola]CAB3657534.1 hypothetical protein LMG24238_01492 [Paraburkholderia sediminicola]
MNQPQALIQGDLALPKLWPFDDVPPPFGSKRRAAQQAAQDAIRRIANPAVQNRLPPSVKHILLYKSPPRRVDSHRFEAAMAEAKHYIDLETRKTGARSSRSDQVCGAAIFVGGSIALAWLLATCAMRDSGVTQELAKKPPVVSTTRSPAADHQQRSDKLAKQAVGDIQPASAITVPSIASASSSGTLVRSNAAVVSQQQTARVIKHESSGHVAKPERKPTTGLMTQDQVAKRLELNRTARAVNRPSVSRQPEWNGVRRSVEDDTVGRTSSWLNWSAQPPRSHVTTRIAVPVDTDWNARMTQRRITDNPDAFQLDRGQQ